jgi:hypothetical protein
MGREVDVVRYNAPQSFPVSSQQGSPMFLSGYFLMVSCKVGPTRDRLGTLMSSITWRPEEKEDAARRSATPLLDRKEHSKIPFGKNKHMDYTNVCYPYAQRIHRLC